MKIIFLSVLALALFFSCNKKQENSDFVDLGKRILLNSLGFSKEIPENVANEMMVKFKKKSFNDLMISIGRGHI